MANGFIIAAPHSGSGKTTVTIGLLRALARLRYSLAPAKIGPDYIDPQFHEVASGQASFNLDGWAMREPLLSDITRQMAERSDLLVIEGVMGLFDGAVQSGLLGHGATADVARFLNLPIILVVDCEGMGQSVAAMVQGFAQFDKSVKVAGVILNKLGSMRHVSMMREALKEIGMPVIGALPRHDAMSLPSRHLGLVQAREHKEIKSQIDDIADHVAAHLDLDLLMSLAQPVEQGLESLNGGKGSGEQCFGPFTAGSHIAVAHDDAFGFFYPHLNSVWREQGCKLSYFSPLGDETPSENADVIYLPGGYPELYAAQLAANKSFKNSLRVAADKAKVIYGECGGYMVLGQGLIDKDGSRHEMAGLLELETSFHARKLHLGYRHIERFDGTRFRAHEFHYASIIKEEGEALFRNINDGQEVYGLSEGQVSGSFMHLIDLAE